VAIRSENIFDVIIIGAGSIGCPIAFYLSQSGLRTLVLDSEASAGQGSNKKAIGGVRATHSDPAKIFLSKRSIEIFSKWKDTYGNDIEWYPGGYCFIAYRQKEEIILKELLNIQHRYGLNIQWLDKQAILDIVPDLQPDNLIGGTFAPDDGNISPLLANHAFYVQAQKTGAIFKFNEKVINLIIHNQKIRGVRTDKSDYGANIVINAAGAWANKICQMAGINMPVKPDSHEAAITEPVARFLNPMIVDIRPLGGSSNYYFYQHITGQILFCLTPNPQIWGYNTEETSDFLPKVSRRMINVMPRLQNIRVRRTWRGLYPMTPDGFPIVGKINEVDGFIVSIGMCGQGLMLGPGVAELIVRIIHNHLTQEDVEILQYISPYRHFVGQEKLK
jgi:sarcosine oxidase subunit beta